MQRTYREKKYYCGEYVEVAIYPVYSKAKWMEAHLLRVQIPFCAFVSIFCFVYRKDADIHLPFSAKICLRKEKSISQRKAAFAFLKSTKGEIIMKSNNQINIPQAREAMDKFKMQAAQEVGVNLTNGYNGHLTSREAGSVGGQMVKKMIEAYEQGMQ